VTLNGIDVSAAGQGNAFPWASSKGKIQFAGIKIAEGLTYADPDAERNIAGARSIGAAVIGYHFLHASLDGAQQLEWFLARAHAAGLKPGDLIALDAEDLGLDGNPSPIMNLTASVFCGQLGKHFAGYHPLAYTEISMAPALTGLGNCPLWLANPSRESVTSIGPWKVVSFEQTGQRGTDTDVFYGTGEQLAKLAIPG
jgi:GH25 family lysozyme M1 (1,4-beta-N-acetylmuramidase)